MDDLLVSMKCRIADWGDENERVDWRAYQAEYAEAAAAIESLRAEIARLTEERDALAEASAYLIDRLTKVSGGIVVRDLEEARGSYDAALAKVRHG